MRDTLRDQLQSALGPSCVLGRELGGGGMSRVFVARDTALARDIVVKALPAELASGMNAERFAREARIAASLSHPHVVTVISSGVVEDVAYYTMPFVPGESLRGRIARGDRFSVSEAVSILRDVARALSAAHAQGIVHRDIKPDNILISGGSAAVSDFGIARALAAATLGDDSDASQRTGVGVVVGTPQYLAPEQATADPTADHRIDIYALGCTAYEMLTGMPPFTRSTTAALIAAHVVERPRALIELRPDVPPLLDALVMQCLEKDPAARPPQALDVLRLLDNIPVSREHGVASQVSERSTKRRWLAVAALVVAAVGATWKVLSDGDVKIDPSVAVLPLETLAADSASIFLGVGLSEELTVALRKVPGLRVAARAAASRMLTDGLSGRDAGKRLGVATVLSGTLRRSGDRLRVTMELTRTADDHVLWADQFERQMRDVFELQDDITRDIVGALRIQLANGDYKAVQYGAADIAAYDAFLRGLHARSRGYDGLAEAAALFNEAVRRDSSFGRAWAALSTTLAQLPLWSGTSLDSVYEASRTAASRALRLDSLNAEPHAALALLYRQSGQLARSDAEFRQAIQLDSASPTTLRWYSEMLVASGRIDEAVSSGRRAYAADSFSADGISAYAHALDLAGRVDDARVLHARALALEPQNVMTRTLAALSRSRAGDHREAMALIDAPNSAYDSETRIATKSALRALASDSAGASQLVRNSNEGAPVNAQGYKEIMAAWSALGLRSSPRARIGNDTIKR